MFAFKSEVCKKTFPHKNKTVQQSNSYRSVWLIYPGHCTPISIRIAEVMHTGISACFYASPCTCVHMHSSSEAGKRLRRVASSFAWKLAARRAQISKRPDEQATKTTEHHLLVPVTQLRRLRNVFESGGGGGTHHHGERRAPAYEPKATLCSSVRENVRGNSKNVKKSCFFGF